MAKKNDIDEIEVGVAETTVIEDCRVLFVVGNNISFDFKGYGYTVVTVGKKYKARDIIKIAYEGEPATEGFVFTEA